MSEIFLPPVEQLINVDLFTALQESDVGQFGPDYTNLERYKQAGEYALEAQMYAQMAEDYGNQTVQKVQQIIENAGDAGTLLTLSLPTGASKVGTESGRSIQQEIDIVVNTCETIEKLRMFEPTKLNQKVVLAKAITTGPIINETFYFDSSDKTSPDNGFSIFVTNNGARWKLDTTFGYNVLIAGYDPALNNLAACINKIGEWFVNSAIADTQINNRKAILLVPGLGYNTTYTLTETIKLPPSLVELRPLTDMIFDFSSLTTTDAIVCSHEYDGLNSGKGNSTNGNSADAGGYVINPQGILYIKGAGITISKNASGDVTSTPSTTGTGIVLGNRSRMSSGTAYLNVRDTKVKNVRVFGFNGGIQFGTHDTYLCTVEDSNFYGNLYNQYQPNATVLNSGEGMRLVNVVLSNAGIDNIYINTDGHDYWYDKIHIDYAQQDGIRFGPDAASTMIMSNSWLEGNFRYVISQPTKTTNRGQCRVLMQGGKIVPNQYQVVYRGVRPIFKSVVYDTLIVELEMVDLNGAYAGYSCNDAYGSWCGLNDQTVLTVRYRHSDTYKWLPRFKYGVGGYLANNIYTFTGTTGAALPTSLATANTESANHWSFASGSATVVYGSSSDADSDGLIPVKITLTAPTEEVFLYCANYVQFPRSGVYLSNKCSVKNAEATGAIIVQSVLRPLTYPNVTSTLNTANNIITNTNTEVSRGSVTGESVDMISAINKPYLTVTSNNFVSTPPLKITNYNKGSLWSNPGLKFTGFVGTIYVKLPAYWFSDLHPN